MKSLSEKIMANRYWSTGIEDLQPYVPGEQINIPNLIKLNTNENPYGPSPKVVQALHDASEGDALRLYPDPEASRLKRELAIRFGVSEEHIFVGNGSDEVLAHAFHALLRHEKPVLFPDVTYSFYPVYCRLYGISYRAIPVATDFSVRLDDYEEECGGIIFPNPNAPTGMALTRERIARLVERHSECVVVIDEAYIDFGTESAVSLITQHHNLLVVQTFSKSRSLAGLRVGFAIGDANLINALERVKNSFNSYPLGRLPIAGAVAALEDEPYFQSTCDRVMITRDRLTLCLEKLGFEVLPSRANFLFARHPIHDALRLAQALRTRHILVRHFRLPRIDQFLRITVGTEQQTDTLLQVLGSILSHNADANSCDHQLSTS